jgi:hypothetical protein
MQQRRNWGVDLKVIFIHGVMRFVARVALRLPELRGFELRKGIFWWGPL